MTDRKSRDGSRDCHRRGPVSGILNQEQVFCLLWLQLPECISEPLSEMMGKGRGFSSVQSLSRVQLFATPWTAARQASLSITNSWSLPKLMSIESVMPSNHLILYRPLLLLPSIFPSIRIFSNELTLHIRWANYSCLEKLMNSMKSLARYQEVQSETQKLS